MAFIVKRDAVVIPAGIPYSSTTSVSINVINFPLFKENTFGDGNLLYEFDEGTNTPTNYYAWSNYDFEQGIGNRAILVFNASASAYYSNQPSNVPNVSLTTNKWYLIVFSAGNYDSDSGGYASVPSTVYVNNSTGQSGNYIPTSGWSSSITITAQSGFGLPASITIAGAVGASSVVNRTYSRTNQPMGYLYLPFNGSYNYQNGGGQFYITSPYNQNSAGDYYENIWVLAYSADGASYYLTNPSSDKFNFPTVGWVYSDINGIPYPNTAGQSGPASITITAA